MRLSDLDPRWVSDEVFVFRCPHCSTTWISCKSVRMPTKEQFDLFRKAGLEPTGRGAVVVPMREDCLWAIGGKDFSSMTVTPSIDASAAGHWHGNITNGEIR